MLRAVRRLAGPLRNALCRACSTTATVSDKTREVYVDRLADDLKGVAVLTMNRPRVKNALGRTMLRQFNEALENLRFDKEVRMVLLASSTSDIFCAGADLSSLPQPTIAVLEGAAIGGGLEMALACDIRICTKATTLGLPETALAIIPGAGGTQRLPRLIGVSRAKELIFTARRLKGEAALQYGIVSYCVEPGQALTKSLEIAREILPRGPIAVRAAKAAISQGIQCDIGTAMEIERLCYAQVIGTQDRLEGLQAFKEKRNPVYTGK